MEQEKIINEFVEKNQSMLKEINDSKELYLFAKKNGYTDSAKSFVLFKKALLNIGIDYDLVKTKTLEKNSKYELVLYSDSNYLNNRFAVCNKDGYPVYYGEFHRTIYYEEEAEIISAKEAIWVARQVKKHNNLNELKLKLYVSAEWLTHQGIYDLAHILTLITRKNNIVLNVEYINSEDNFANKYVQKPDGNSIKRYKHLDINSKYLILNV